MCLLAISNPIPTMTICINYSNQLTLSTVETPSAFDTVVARSTVDIGEASALAIPGVTGMATPTVS